MAYERTIEFVDQDYRVLRIVTVKAQTSKELGVLSAQHERRPGEHYVFTRTRNIDR